LLMDSVAVVASSADPAELAQRFTARLFETLQARRVGVVERLRPGSFDVLAGFERTSGGTRPFVITQADLAILERSSREAHFVGADGDPAESSLYALPLFLQDRWLG